MTEPSHVNDFLKLQKDKKPCWWSRLRRKIARHRPGEQVAYTPPGNPIHDLLF